MNYPYLPDAHIRRAAEELLVDAFGHPSEVQLPVDLEVIVFDHLCEREGLSFSDEEPLPSTDGSEVLGKTLPLAGQIRVVAGLREEHLGRYRFTVAHELGHWVLHRPLWLARELESELFGDNEAEPEIVTLSRDIDPPSGTRARREEYQANTFASSLLIPPELLRIEYQRRFRSGSPIAKPGGTAEELRRTARDLAKSTAQGSSPLYRTFEVSIEAMAIALVSHGYVTDKPTLFP